MKQKINHCLYLGTLLLLFNGHGQSPESYFNDLSLPSPAAFEMTRYDAQQPNLYTGTASVNIPLYTINFDGWQIPLSLSYHAGGIRVNQEATEVGLGWSLNATGVISRVIKSGDDLVAAGSVLNEPDVAGRKGYVYETKDWYDICENWWDLDEETRILYQTSFKDDEIDGEPDRFNYNFFGYSGSFVFEKILASEQIPIKKITVDAVDLDFVEESLTFVITTPDGFKGYFSVQERTTGLSGTSSSNPLPSSQEYFSSGISDGVSDTERNKFTATFRNITGWYLDRIESPNGKILNFNYDLRADGLSDYVSIGMPSFSENRGYSTGTGSIGFSRQVVEHVYLNQITIENELEVTFQKDVRQDLGKLDLPYSTAAFPQNGTINYPKKYTGITINSLDSGSQFTKNIDLHQSYFNQDALVYSTRPFEKYQKLRLRLDAVSIDEQKYEFGYYHGMKGLPNKSSLGMDHQGFYNGNDHLSTLNPVKLAFPFTLVDFKEKYETYPDKRYYYFLEERSAKLEYAVAGALEYVRYPTGGRTNYLYGLHDFYTEGPTAITEDRPLTHFAPALPSFNSYGQDHHGSAGNIPYGGLRIQEIKLFDKDDEPVSRKSYSFKGASTTNSSGVLLNPIYYVGLINKPEPNPDNERYTLFKSFSIPGRNTAQGSEIGYDRVVETVWAKDGTSYASEHYFENHRTRPTALQIDQTPHLENLNHLNGKTNLKTDYNSTNNQVSRYKVDAFNEQLFGELKAVGHYSIDIGLSSPTFSFNLYTLPITHTNPLQVTKTAYFENGESNTVENFTYDGFAQLKASATTSSKGKSVVNNTHRLKDYGGACGPMVDQKCMYTWLFERNMVSAPIEQVQTVSGQVIGATAYRYGIENGLVVLKEIFRHNQAKGSYVPSQDGFTFGGGYESVITFDRYSNNGKLLQQTLKDGITQSYIWDDTNTYPVVKGINIDYDELNTAFVASQGANFESAIRDHALTKNAQISTFEADPLIGVHNMAGPNAIAQYYGYDDNERLRNVKDSDNHLLNEYLYAYGDYSRFGGLQAVTDFDFGPTQPGDTNTKEITITNAGNYGITIDNISATNNFSPDHPFWVPVYLPPNDQFKVKITYTAPISAALSHGVLTVTSDDLNGSLTIDLSGESVYFEPQLHLPETCLEFTKNTDPNNTFQYLTKSVRIENLGNGPLTFRELISDDPHLKISDFTPKRRYTEDGVLYFEPYTIAANDHKDVGVELISYDQGGDWDGDAKISMLLHNDSNYVGNPEINFYWDITSQCSDPPPSDPVYQLTGTTVAGCYSEMDGSLTINHGEVRIRNESNPISGVNYIGATITIPGLGTLTPGQSLLVSPTTYPQTYNFTSSTADCSNNGYGNSKLRVFIQ